jgi:hypothetical protein
VVLARGPLDTTLPDKSKIVSVWKMRFGARLRAVDFWSIV